MKNFIQEGDVIKVAAPYDVASGAGAQVGTALFGVAVATAASGADVQLMREGVFELAKTSAQAWTVGDKIYWDNTNKVATSTASTNLYIGLAVAAAANPSSTGRVLLAAV